MMYINKTLNLTLETQAPLVPRLFNRIQTEMIVYNNGGLHYNVEGVGVMYECLCVCVCVCGVFFGPNL